MTAVLGFVAIQFDLKEITQIPILLGGIGIFIPLIIAMVILARIIFPRAICHAGSNPEHIMLEKFIDGYEGDVQTIQLILNECENYQDRININDEVNTSNLRRFRRAVWIGGMSPLVGLCLYGTGLFIAGLLL